MSSRVCQGLQSCLEPRLTEPRILRLKLTPPRSSPTHSFEWTNKLEKTNTITKNDITGWNTIQDITKTIEEAPKKENEKVYVHPLIKRSASFLSEKSLEMCTESLGSETGSDISENIDEIHFPFENSDFSPKDEFKMSKTSGRAKRNLTRSNSFPPPLKSISASVRVKPHREGGRLVLKAVTVPSSNTFFHAERSHGRLMLRLLKGNSDEEEVEEEREENDGVSEVEDEAEEEFDDEGEDDNSVFWGGEMNANNEDDEGGNGIEGKISTPTRCKESGHKNKGLWDLEPYWVAT